MNRLSHKAAAWVFGLAGAFSLATSEAAPRTGELTFSSVARPGQMPEGEVRALSQDGQARIWIATDGGITRFDGYEVRAVEPGTWGQAGQTWNYLVTTVGTVMPERSQRSWSEAGRPVVWVGTAGLGLVRYDPDADRADVVGGGLSTTRSVQVVLATEKGIWIGTDGGLDFLPSGMGAFPTVAQEKDRPVGRVLALVADPQGRIWTAVAEQGVFRREDQGGWVRMADDADVVALAGGGDSLVVGTRSRLVCLDWETGEERAVLSVAEERVGPAAEGIRSLLRDKRGTIWAGTNSGLWRFRQDEESWVQAVHRPGNAGSIPPGAVTALWEDRAQEALLVGTSEGHVALHQLSTHWFPFYAEGPLPHGLPGASVGGFANARGAEETSEEGKVWITTDRGIAQFDIRGETFTVPAAWDQEFLRHGAGPVLEDSTGRLWMGAADGGLWMADLDGDGVLRRALLGTDGEDSLGGREEVGFLLEDRNGSIWVAVRGRGVYRRRSTEDLFASVGIGGEVGRVRDVSAMAEGPDGGLWVASVIGGLWYVTEGGERAVRYRDLPGNGFELPSENVTALLVGKDGAVWAATVGAGLCKLTFPEGTLKVYGRQNRKLPHWVIYGLAEDDEGNIWMTTGAGLVQLNPKTEETRVFGMAYGVQGSGFSPNAVLRTRDGELLFGGTRGFYRVDPRRLPAPDPAPVAVLAGLELYGEPVVPGRDGVLRKPLALTDRLDLPFDRRMRVAIRFATLGGFGTRPAKFRFRLNGLEQEWVSAGEETKALYTGLRPGSYEFEVQASPDGETWGAATARLSVRVVPPWPHSWWARGLYGVLAVALCWTVFWFQGRERRREESAHRQRLENERNQAETALSRQLQQAMLLERTTSELRRGLDGRQVFDSALQRVAAHFQASRCILLSVDEPANGAVEWVAGFPEDIQDRLPEDFAWGEIPLVKRALATSKVVRGVLNGAGPGSAIAIQTTHLEVPNGVLLLQQQDRERVWETEEEALLQAVSAQFGMVLAQFLLAQREAEQRLELEAARQAADAANRAKSEFLAKMTHELRTPLNAIIGFSEIMGLDDSLDSRFREHLDIINSSGEHLLGVISDVLEVSKIEAGKAELVLERFELEKLLRSVHGMFSVAAASKAIELRLIPLGSFPGLVEADKGKLRQILINLVGNAIKFTRQGGVALRAGVRLEEDTPSVGGRKAARLLLEVSDTGPGIAAGEETKLFQKFVQTETGLASQQGTGLGLAIVKGFAELMGGEVEVISRLGYGSLFRVEVPCTALETAAEQSVAELVHGHVVGLAPGERPRRILVAEDQPLNRLLLNRLLSKAGFDWREVENGELAVQAYREFRPELILMDEDMPRLRGTQATRIILEEARRLGDPEPKIVSLTAFSLEAQRQAAREAGCHGFLSKPFKQEELFGLIGALLGVRYAYSSDVAEPQAAA